MKRTVCKLYEKDIIQIIADHFNVGTEKVELMAHLRMIEIGSQGDEEEHFVTCEVELPANGCEGD